MKLCGTLVCFTTELGNRGGGIPKLVIVSGLLLSEHIRSTDQPEFRNCIMFTKVFALKIYVKVILC